MYYHDAIKTNKNWIKGRRGRGSQERLQDLTKLRNGTVRTDLVIQRTGLGDWNGPQMKISSGELGGETRLQKL